MAQTSTLARGPLPTFSLLNLNTTHPLGPSMRANAQSKRFEIHGLIRTAAGSLKAGSTTTTNSVLANV